MALGPGKYDDLCSHVRRKAMAKVAVVLIVGGKRGAGFSCQMASASIQETALATRQLVSNLRFMADQLEADADRMLAMTEEQAKRAVHSEPDPEPPERDN